MGMPPMTGPIEVGFMVFVKEGAEGIGAVRLVNDHSILVYVENAGEFSVPLSAVTSVHDQKVMLDPIRVDKKLLAAAGHAHDREDPNVAG
jgi:hypothetical protein